MRRTRDGCQDCGAPGMDFSVCMPLPLSFQSSNLFSSSSLSFYHLVVEEENLLLKVFVFTPPFPLPWGLCCEQAWEKRTQCCCLSPPFPFTLRLVEMKKKKGMYKMVCVCGKGAVLAPSPLFPVSSSLLEVWACWGT